MKNKMSALNVYTVTENVTVVCAFLKENDAKAFVENVKETFGKTLEYTNTSLYQGYRNEK